MSDDVERLREALHREFQQRGWCALDTDHRTYASPPHCAQIADALAQAEQVSPLSDIQVGTKAGMTPDRIKRIVQDADYALTALEQGDTENALMALRRGFQRGPVRLRAQAEAERERRGVERMTRALRPVTRHLFVAGGDKGYEKWLADTAEKVAREYEERVNES